MSDKRSQFRAIILEALGQGKWAVGSRLPTEAELTRQYGLSRATIREGITTLVQEGLLIRRKRAGTIVARLRSKPTSQTIAVIVKCVRGQSDSVNQVLRYIEDRTHDQGYSLILCNHDNDADRLDQYLQRATRDGVAGVLFSPLEGPDRKDANLAAVRLLESRNVPFVLFGNPISSDTLNQFSFVGSNGYSATRDLVSHLAGLGHRRIAFICFPGAFTSDQRLAGYLEEMRSRGLEVPKGYIQQLKPVPVELQGQEEVRALLALRPAPTAVIGVHDLIAKNVVEEVRRLGRKVPDDLAVVGFGDMAFASVMYPPLTTVHIPIEDEAAAETTMLFEKISGKFTGEKQIFFPCRLVVRRSCGAVPAGDVTVVHLPIMETAK